MNSGVSTPNIRDEYDPDEGLEIQPEVAEELEQSITDHKSGRVKGTPLQEVAKTFGVNLSGWNLGEI